MPIADENYKLIILYTAVAYAIGVILHELGKLIAERTRLFSVTALQHCSFCEKTNYGYGRKVKEEYENIVSEVISYITYTHMKFHDALNELKFNSNISTKRIDKYHSVYGMSRSLSLCFLIHAIIKFAGCICEDTDIHALKANLIFSVIDIVLVVLFLNRAYRYFSSWVRNVLIQAYIEKGKNNV